MAAGAWKIYATAKEGIGDATIDLDAGVFKMSLHRTSASASIDGLSAAANALSISSEITAQGGYTKGGKNLANVTWVTGHLHDCRFSVHRLWCGTQHD